MKLYPGSWRGCSYSFTLPRLVSSPGQSSSLPPSLRRAQVSPLSLITSWSPTLTKPNLHQGSAENSKHNNPVVFDKHILTLSVSGSFYFRQPSTCVILHHIFFSCSQFGSIGEPCQAWHGCVTAGMQGEILHRWKIRALRRKRLKNWNIWSP